METEEAQKWGRHTEPMADAFTAALGGEEEDVKPVKAATPRAPPHPNPHKIGEPRADTTNTFHAPKFATSREMESALAAFIKLVNVKMDEMQATRSSRLPP